MATVYVTMGTAGVRGGNRDDVIVLPGWSSRGETITSSGASAQGSLQSDGEQIAVIYCDTAVWAKTGENPTAAAATSVFVPGTIPTAIGIQDGEIVAVIDA